MNKIMGMPLCVEPSHALPLVDVELVVLRGALGDPDGLEGLTHLTARLMRRGPKGMKAEAFDEQLDRLGATLGLSVSHEHMRLGGTVLRRNLEPYLTLLGRMLTQPALRPKDFSKLRRRSIADRVALRDHDRSLAARAFRRELFGAHPYGRPVAGTQKSLAKIRRADVLARHEALVRRGHILIGIAGDITEAEVAPLLEGALADVPKGQSRRPRARAPKPQEGRRVFVVDKPERSQTQLYVGTLGAKVGDPGHAALVVGNTGFGGTFTSRLMKEVRSERGWSYGASSRVGADRQRDAWTMWTHPGADQLVDCLALELDLLDQWVAKGLSGAEVKRAKRFLIKSHAFDRETASKRLEPRLEALAYGLPEDWPSGFAGRVGKVTAKAAKAAVIEHLDPSALTIAMVATATPELLAGLSALPGIASVQTLSVTDL